MTRLAVRTLTLNPSIDVSSDTERVEPTVKLRTVNERMDPGGGGINVARVLQRFGIGVEALFLAGGATGAVLDDLLGRQGVARRAIGIADDTRTSLTVHERSTGCEYRFVPEGPQVTASELEAALAAAAQGECEFLVASGSLPPGAPDDVYARLASRVRAETRFVLDTSGPELKAALTAGGVFLVKPSKGELEQLAGRTLPGREAVAGYAAEFVRSRQVEHFAVTLGREGALLVNADGTFFLPAVPLETRSTVGAGDSFLAGMTVGFASGRDALDSFRLGAACGAASALSPGTGLAHPDEARRLLEQIGEPERI